MDDTAAALDRLAADLNLLLCGDRLADLTDAERWLVLARIGAVQRRVEALVVETVATAAVVREIVNAAQERTICRSCE
ncbi:hypothetical protein [Microbacterium sp. USHLN186]|uniref:hypothetical protein n=1 Tax=Microbacterium sp. USHLN186 TaxID=3081286 RepID=UPI0030180842